MSTVGCETDTPPKMPAGAWQIAGSSQALSDAWAERIRNVSRLALDYPQILSSGVSMAATAENRFMVTSEGTLFPFGGLGNDAAVLNDYNTLKRKTQKIDVEPCKT